MFWSSVHKTIIINRSWQHTLCLFPLKLLQKLGIWLAETTFNNAKINVLVSFTLRLLDYMTDYNTKKYKHDSFWCQLPESPNTNIHFWLHLKVDEVLVNKNDYQAYRFKEHTLSCSKEVWKQLSFGQCQEAQYNFRTKTNVVHSKWST